MEKIKKVLVIDDSKLARLTLSRLLKGYNIDVLEAESVAMGHAILKKDKVDAIFLDVQMPEQDGFEGLKIFKSDDAIKHIPISMYSSDISLEARKEAVTNGAQAYLFKPANNEHLEPVLQALNKNVVAEDVKPFLTSARISKDSGIFDKALEKQSAHITKHKKVLIALDERTHKLAQLFTHEKSNTTKTINTLLKRSERMEGELNSLKKRNEYALHDDLLHKHSENDLRGQLKKTRDNQRIIMTLSLISFIFSVSVLLLVAIIYFKLIVK